LLRFQQHSLGIAFKLWRVAVICQRGRAVADPLSIFLCAAFSSEQAICQRKVI
jgi:hypothetical protein